MSDNTEPAGDPVPVVAYDCDGCELRYNGPGAGFHGVVEPLVAQSAHLAAVAAKDAEIERLQLQNQQLAAEIGDPLDAQIAALKAELDAMAKDAEWIPCSERMPIEGQQVFVFSSGRWKDVARYTLSKFVSDDYELASITHWKPLPPAPPAMAQEKPD